MLKTSRLHGEFWAIIRHSRSSSVVSTSTKISVLDKAFSYAIHCDSRRAIGNCRRGVYEHCIRHPKGSRKSHISFVPGSTSTYGPWKPENIWVGCANSLKQQNTEQVVWYMYFFFFPVGLLNCHARIAKLAHIIFIGFRTSDYVVWNVVTVLMACWW